MLAYWGMITDVRKPEIMVMTSLYIWRAIYWLLRSPSQTCHAKPKTQINRRRTLPASFRQDAHRKKFTWKTSLRKVRTLWHCSRLRSVAITYDWSWYIRQAIDRCSNIRLSLPGAGYGQFSSMLLTAWLQNLKEAGGTVREIDVWAESLRLSPVCYLHHRLPVMGC